MCGKMTVRLALQTADMSRVCTSHQISSMRTANFYLRLSPTELCDQMCTARLLSPTSHNPPSRTSDMPLFIPSLPPLLLPPPPRYTL